MGYLTHTGMRCFHGDHEGKLRVDDDASRILPCSIMKWVGGGVGLPVGGRL